mgnify:CR=1 FL=1
MNISTSHNAQKNHLWLIGTGYMALEYTKVLNFLKKKYNVIGRSKNSCDKFFNETNINPIRGGLLSALNNYEIPKQVIVSVSVENLFECTYELLNRGVKEILLEKPGGLNINEIKILKDLEIKNNARLYIAYNRRFYTSVIKLLELLANDKPIKSLNFEFTEFGHKLKNDNSIKKNVLNKWLYANSSHVIDLAFFLMGKPKKNQSSFYTSGYSIWHKPIRFHGSGISINNVQYSYKADWESQGRWGIEVLTNNYKYILQPLEELHYIKKGEFIKQKIYLKKTIEDNFKPGLLNQCEAFFSEDSSSLCNISEQYEHFEFYQKISGY